MKRLTPDIIFESGHRSSDLAEKSIQGGVSIMLAQGIQFVLQVVGTIVLARLLIPADYGLIGMVTVVVNFAQMFKDAGLSMATVQKEKIAHEQISTLFWINVFISFFFGMCVLFGSPLVAGFYGKSELTTVTAVLSISFIISGLSIQHAALLRRHMHFVNIAIVQIFAQFITLAVTIVLALYGWRYWALVGGSLTTAFVTVALTFFFCPWIPGRMHKGVGVRDMLKFGGHLTGFNFINYFSRNLDNIIIGRFIGVDSLGLYTKAYQLFMMPIAQIRGPMTNVAMPVLSMLKNQPVRYRKYYQRIIDIMATLTVPMTTYCVIEADFIIRLVLGPQWMGAVDVFRILAIAGMIQPVAGTRGLILLSNGYSQRYFYWGIFNAIFCIISFIVGLPYGIEGIAGAYALANYVILIPSLFYCFHETPVTVSLFLKTFFAPLLSGMLAALSVLFLRYFLPDDSFFVHGLSFVFFVLVYGGLSFCRQTIRETFLMIFKGSKKSMA